MAQVQDALAFRGRVASTWIRGDDVMKYRHVVIGQFGGPEVLQVTTQRCFPILRSRMNPSFS